jgi:para-nitrobenzyl esterase
MPHWNYNNGHNRKFPFGKTLVVGSEDCLNVNVYTPLTATPGSKLPVLVYFFPGGDTGGDNRENFSAYTDAGLVVVVPNYRLGPFGFAGFPATVFGDNEITSPNVGYYDQVFALQWVHDNIAAFGGDPNTVTITGASAGAKNTGDLLANPYAQGLFQRAIVATYYTSQFLRLRESLLFGATATTFLGCDQAADVAACLRSKSYEEIDTAWANVAGPSPDGFWYGPVLDGITLLDEPGHYVKTHGTVPLMFGHMAEEDIDNIFFGDQLPLDAIVAKMANYLHTIMPGMYYPFPTQDDFVTLMTLYPLIGQTAPTPVPADRLRYADAFHGIIAFLTDLNHGCPTRMIGDGAAANGGNPVFRYVMTRAQASPFFPYPAASHMLQDFYATGFLDWGDANGFGWGLDPLTPEMYLLSAQMTQYWANFARNGDPNGPGLPHWPQYDLNAGGYMQLDTPVTTGTHYHDAECAFWGRLYFNAPYVPMPEFAASGSVDLIGAIVNPLIGCGLDFLGLPDCSTVGYVGSPDGR